MAEKGTNKQEWAKIAHYFTEDKKPKNREQVKKVVKLWFDVDLIDKARCADHQSQLDYVADSFLGEYGSGVFIGTRGGGKSFLTAIVDILKALYIPGHKIAVTAFARGQSAEVEEKARVLLEKFNEITNTRGVWVTRNAKGGSQSFIEFATGSQIGFFAGARSPANIKAFHPHDIRVDEADLWPLAEIEKLEFALYDDGTHGTQIVYLSADYNKGNSASAINTLVTRLDNYNATRQPGLRPASIFRMCVLDTVQKCTDKFQCLNEGNKVPCALWPYCKGNLKRTDVQGHSSLAKALEEAGRSSKPQFEAQMLLIRQEVSEVSYFCDFSIAANVNDPAVEYDTSKETFLTFDFGGGRCEHAALLIQRDKAGVYTVVDEWLCAASIEVMAANIRGKYPQMEWKYCFADPNGAKKQKAQGAESYVDVLRRLGFPVKTRANMPGSRREGFEKINAVIVPAEGKATRLKINKRCVNLIKQVQAAEHKTHKGQLSNEPADITPDDLLDCLRYTMQWTLGRDLNRPRLLSCSINDLMNQRTEHMERKEREAKKWNTNE